MSSTPFIDLVFVGVNWERRFLGVGTIGAQAGVFVAKLLRVAAKVSLTPEDIPDDQENIGHQSKSMSVLYGASVGVAAIRTPIFVMSPGLAFARTDVSDYGTMIGLSLPVDWVTHNGLRFGLEGQLGRAFGGRRVVSCSINCAATSFDWGDRPAGTALSLQLSIGFGFRHPPPLPPSSP